MANVYQAEWKRMNGRSWRESGFVYVQAESMAKAEEEALKAGAAAAEPGRAGTITVVDLRLLGVLANPSEQRS